MTLHVVFNQSDPTRHVVGGIPGFIRELVAFAPPEHSFRIVGVDSDGSRPLGEWRRIAIDGREAELMTVARLDPADQSRRVPHSARFVAGILRYRPDTTGAVVQSHRVEVGATLSLIHPRTPRVLFVHGDSRDVLEHRVETFWRLAPRSFLAAERLAVRTSSHTVVMSSSGLARLGAGPRASLGSNWYDGRWFHPGDALPPHQATIAWIGRFEPPKDPLRAVEVFAALKERGVPFTAWMAGSGTLVDEVAGEVRRRGLEDEVSLVGVLEPERIADRLRGSSALLMTSLWEGFPRTLVEALACGVPVVSTRVGEARSIVSAGRNGWLADTGAPADELAARVADALSLTDRRRIAGSVAHLDGQVVVAELLGRLAALERR